MNLVGIRGAITVKENNTEDIISATKELLIEIIKKNHLSSEKIISIFFSCTKDLNSAYPAVAARELGFTNTALFCCQEMDVVGSLPMCIRILIHTASNNEQKSIKHIYMREAQILRPDLDDREF